MATPLNLFVYLFGLIGLVAVIAIIYYVYLSYSRRQKKNQETRWPPRNFMKYIGARCPTGWEYQGTIQGNDGTRVDQCANIYDVDIAEPSNDACYSNRDEKIQFFRELSNWPLRKSERERLLKDRCKFVKSCGANKGQFATWFGIDSLC